MAGGRFAAVLLVLAAFGLSGSDGAAANPIRKVVTMLQNMQRKVTEEGKADEELYHKFMCYCQTNGGALSQSISDGGAKIESVGAALKSNVELKAQTEASLKEHQASRAAANDAVREATAIREKEAAEFAKVKSDDETNIAALKKAVSSLEKGVAGAFLQTTEAGLVRRYAMERAEIPDSTRQELLAFLSGSESSGYVPQSGEIIGILKQIGDEMDKHLSDATEEETGRIQVFEALMLAKKKEISTLQRQIENEMKRVGDLGVEIASMQNDLEDTQQALSEDEKFKKQLEKGCATKTAEWEEVKKTRAEELVALADTIRVLNDDDALDVFKKTLPSASSSLMQVKISTSLQRLRALEMIRVAARRTKRPELDLIALALSGKTAGFAKIVKMIDTMVANLKKEQVSDDSKKEYCETQLDQAEDKQKTLGLSLSDSEKDIDEMEGTIGSLKEEIAALEAGIKALDKSVADATEQRKEENAAYKELMSSNGVAKDVLGWAKNRLNKFYNPALYKPPPKVELSSGDRIVVSMGGTLTTTLPGGIAGTNIGAASFAQVNAHTQRHRDAPPPPPETFKAYTNKGEQGRGVIAMIDLLVKELDKEMSEATVMEKDAQADYEAMMGDAAAKRAADSKSMTQKSSAKADTEEALVEEKEKKASTAKEHMATARYIASLHQECDWLMQYHETRKTARDGEIESLVNAKAVLNGADYALIQTGALRPSRRSGFMAARH